MGKFVVLPTSPVLITRHYGKFPKVRSFVRDMEQAFEGKPIVNEDLEIILYSRDESTAWRKERDRNCESESVVSNF